MSDVRRTFREFVSNISQEIGPPPTSVLKFNEQFSSEHGNYRRLAAVWRIKDRSHGIEICYFNGKRFRLRAWGHGESVYDVEMWMTRDPIMADLTYAAELVGLY